VIEESPLGIDVELLDGGPAASPTAGTNVALIVDDTNNGR
jgi:hypothetical protein